MADSANKYDIDESTIGSSFESFLDEVGIKDVVYEDAAKSVIAWQLSQAIKESGVSKTEIAARAKTSRSQIDRILDPENPNVSIDALEKVARAVGRHLNIELVDMPKPTQELLSSEQMRKRA